MGIRLHEGFTKVLNFFCFLVFYKLVIVFLNILNSCRVVIGYDEGTIMIKIGREEPVASMDSSGKIIWAKHNEIQTVNIKSVGADAEVIFVNRVIILIMVDFRFRFLMLLIC